MSAAKFAAIHQPNFFPWLGYFNKLALADAYIALDDVQHTKTGSNWSNRVKLLVGDEARWVTAPIQRPATGGQMLDQVKWADEPWRAKVLKTVTLNYQRAPFFDEAMDLLEPLILNPEPLLVPYNLHAIRIIASALGIHREVIPASRFALGSVSNQRLIDLTKAASCDGYISGGGASGYQEEGLFAEAGLQLKYQHFAHPNYQQKGSREFKPGLSVIDALMNCGVERTRELVWNS